MNKKVQVFSITVAQELQMKFDPILGTSYQLENCIIENDRNTEIIKDCKHNSGNLIEIGKRNYCNICGDWVNNPLNNH